MEQQQIQTSASILHPSDAFIRTACTMISAYILTQPQFTASLVSQASVMNLAEDFFNYIMRVNVTTDGIQPQQVASESAPTFG